MCASVRKRVCVCVRIAGATVLLTTVDAQVLLEVVFVFEGLGTLRTLELPVSSRRGHVTLRNRKFRRKMKPPHSDR